MRCFQKILGVTSSFAKTLGEISDERLEVLKEPGFFKRAMNAQASNQEVQVLVR